ncbi:hypothetical protein CPB83DRAFT_843588 [Crepidotus variabilis]|uniref:Uncharacterized protein n=1 Tax=Crepidotus variabilis TaxID=179855 RepID=A0A9P6JWX9_9AGAR|nr:hypothetical protein CPB83DRAFT_843588 [Crepidotus variabilis]
MSKEPKIAKGSIKSSGGTTFLGSFVVEGVNYVLEGRLSPAVREFESKTVELTYKDLSQLDTENRQPIDGQIGPTDIALNFNNGPKLSGKLEQPAEHGTRIGGLAKWIKIPPNPDPKKPHGLERSSEIKGWHSVQSPIFEG